MANLKDLPATAPIPAESQVVRASPDSATLVKRPESSGTATITLRRRPAEDLPGKEPGSPNSTAPEASRPTLKKNPVLRVKAYTGETQRLTLEPRHAVAMQRAAAELSTLVFPPENPLRQNRPAEKAPSTQIGLFLAQGGDSSAPAAGPLADSRGTSEVFKVLRGTPFFKDIPDAELLAASNSQDIVVLTLKRDLLLDQPGRALLLLSGQLSLGLFQASKLERERREQRQHSADPKHADKAEYRRRLDVGPLIRIAEKNLAAFSPGDLIELKDALPSAPATLFTVTPAKLVSVARSLMDSWAARFEGFRDRRRRASNMTQDRLTANDSERERGLVADFFVRHGKSIATTMRVRDLEKCIECYACERACEERYGAQRLFLNGKVLGTLDFVNCCQTCVDQRCVDACGYDAIRYDVPKGEVIIQEDACTGCTMCAKACPYDAITMYELDETPLLKLRLTKEKKLEYGADKPRKAALRRVASKCDHCASYADQACITACPTDALLEVPPLGLFAPRTEEMNVAAASAYPFTVRVHSEDLFLIDPFIGRMKIKQAGAAKKLNIEKGLFLPWLWLLSALAVLGCAAEIGLRFVRPQWSLQFLYATRIAHQNANLAQLDVVYRASSELGTWLGRFGAVLMFSTLLYSVFARTRWLKRLPFVKKIDSQGWFDYHVWAGTMGALLVALHGGFNLNPKITSLAALTSVPALMSFWLMAAVILSGLVGRYLAPGTPALAAQALLRQRALQEDLARLRNQHGGVLAADQFFERLGQRYARIAAPEPVQPRRWGVMPSALFALLLDELSRPLRAFKLHRRLSGITDRTARAQVVKLIGRLAVLHRQAVLTPLLAPLFRGWRLVHVPLAIVLSLTAIAHIVFEEIIRPILENGAHL